MRLSAALGGLAGACTLALINETVKRVDRNAPRLDLLGMNVVAKLLQKDRAIQPLENKIKPKSLVGELISNSLFYGMAGAPTKNQTIIRGALLGLGAGLGAVTIPKTISINGAPVNYSLQTKLLTVAWYVIGGLAAATVINALESDIKSQVSGSRSLDEKSKTLNPKPETLHLT